MILFEDRVYWYLNFQSPIPALVLVSADGLLKIISIQQKLDQEKSFLTDKVNINYYLLEVSDKSMSLSLYLI